MEEEKEGWSIHGVEPSDPGCLHSVEDMIAFVNRVGFIPLFHNEIEGFSVEEHTIGTDWWSGDSSRDPWEWREVAARSGKVLYGKIFNGKAGFLSKEWIPYFANYRRDGYDYSALWEDEKASYVSKKIMDLFDEETELYSFEMKKRAGFGKDGLKSFDGVVTKLQMQIYLCVRDFRRRKNKAGKEYGWPTSVYVMPEAIWGYEFVTSAYGETPQKSYERIVCHVKERYPKAEPAQFDRVFPPMER